MWGAGAQVFGLTHWWINEAAGCHLPSHQEQAVTVVIACIRLLTDSGITAESSLNIPHFQFSQAPVFLCPG